MSESDTAEPSTAEAATDDTAKSERKRVRHRKKQLYERILRQMEFYFSDANLTKDRFLSELTRTDPAVPIETFLRFNKIRALTNSVSEIAKAISSSTFLVCSDDKTKVRRVTPVRAYDAELRTVYVESVPAKASREWLEEVFREYGSVAYISLPKFNNSTRIKGFAFVEFEKPEDAQRCLSAFTKMGCKLPTCMPPEDLSTIKTFSADQPDDSIEQSDKSTPNTPTEESKSLIDSLIKKDDLKRENKDKLNQENKYNVIQENIEKLNQDKDESGTKEERKRQAGTVEDEPPRKKQKGNKKKRRNEEHDVKQSAEEPSAGTTVEESKKVGESTAIDKMDESLDSSKEESSKAEQKSKKKCRTRTAKERNKSKSIGNTEAPKPVLWGLQVLSKTEWRVLRNKYLNLQRKHMKEVKNALRMKGVHQAPAPNKEERRQTVAEGRSAEGVRDVERTEGVFVKVELPGPCLDVRLTKRQVRSNVHVQHVDVKEGQTDMCVRFDTPEAAAQYCSSGIYASARVLHGQESLDEWARATQARGGGGAGRRARGRTRLLQRAAAAELTVPALPPRLGEPTTHIRFDE